MPRPTGARPAPERVPRLGRVAALLLGALLIVGCGPAEPLQPAPLFASDAEALDAATEAYREYLAVFDEVVADPESDPRRLEEVAGGATLESDMDGLRNIREREMTFSGVARLINTELLNRGQIGSQAEVALRVCIDYTGVTRFEPGREPTPVGSKGQYSAKSATLRFESSGQGRVVAHGAVVSSCAG